MALLTSFVSFLNEEEKLRIATMPLGGKEKKLRDALLVQADSSPSKEDLMRMVALTSTHYDKISTLLLKKSYRYLTSDNELEQLNFLSKKFMFQHLFHEIRQFRSRLKKMKLKKEEFEKYYRAFFDFSINVPAKYFDEKFVMLNADDYLRYVTKKHEAREFEVKSKLLFARLNLLTQGAPDNAEFEKIEAEIKRIERKFAKVKAPEIKAILYHTWVNFYRIVRPDWRKRSHYLAMIAKAYGGERKLPVFERAVAALHGAEMLYERGDYARAFDAYSQSFSLYMPMLRNQFHHFARWIEVALILEQYDQAFKLLESLFKIYVINRHESNGVLGSLLYAQYYLLTGDLSNAFHYISLAKSLNSIQVYFYYELKMRMLETTYFAFNKDFEFVSRLAGRNMRYIQFHNLSLKKYKYAHFFFVIKDFGHIRTQYPNRLPAKIRDYIAEFNEGYDYLLWKILDKLLRS